MLDYLSTEYTIKRNIQSAVKCRHCRHYCYHIRTFITAFVRSRNQIETLADQKL